MFTIIGILIVHSIFSSSIEGKIHLIWFHHENFLSLGVLGEEILIVI